MSIYMEQLVLGWAEERGLLQDGTVSGQIEKLKEEFQELLDAIQAGDPIETADAIGDMQVVLIILAQLQGMSATKCLTDAYMEISKRTGKMINGQFVKDNAA